MMTIFIRLDLFCRRPVGAALPTSIVPASTLIVHRPTAGPVCTPSPAVQKFLRLELLRCTVPNIPFGRPLVLCPAEHRIPRIHAAVGLQIHSCTAQSQTHPLQKSNSPQRCIDLRRYHPSWQPSLLNKIKKGMPPGLENRRAFPFLSA